MGQTLPKDGSSRFDGGKYNTIGGMAASMVEEYTFKVEYLGSLMLGKAPTGLGVIQKPLRELYLNNIRKNDSKIRAQERVIKIRPEGILMTYKDSSGGQNKHGFYDMSSIHFKEAVSFVIRKGSDKKLRGVFEPLAERQKGTADNFFTILDKKYTYLVDKKHPGLFVCIMRRPLGVKALDCHVFIMASQKEALQIVDIIDQLQVNVETPNVIPESPTSLSTGQGSMVEVPNVQAYRPTEHPSQQTSGQRYELRDDFFRPQAYYDQYGGDARDFRDSEDIRSDISGNSRTVEGVAMFHNAVDEYGRPTHRGNESEVRMRHPVNRNNLNASFDDRRYLSVDPSFEEQKRRPNPNLSFDETRRPFSMFQEVSRRDEDIPNGYGQRISSDDAVLNNRVSGGNVHREERSPTKMPPKQQTQQYQQQQQQQKQHYYHQQQQQQQQSQQRPLESPSGDASVQDLTAAFERENRKAKQPLPPPGNRSLSPTPRTAAKPDRNSQPLSPTSPSGQPKSPSPGWGQPMASMSNLESRQEMEKGKRASEPTEILEETAKTRPVAKVPPHLVAGVKVLPTEFKVPLRKISPQTSPRCEDPDRYNKLSTQSHNRHDDGYRYPNDYPQTHNSDRYDFQKPSNNYNGQNNYNDQSGQKNSRNSGGPGNYRDQGYPEYNYGGQPNYNKSYQEEAPSNRYDPSQDWGYRDRPPYGGPGIRDPATGEIDKPPGSLKDKEIASMVSNIYIGEQPHMGRNTNFEQSLGYYP